MSSICLTCLKDINKLQTVDLNKAEDAVKQMKHVLPEIILEPEIPVYMCSTCHTKLHSFYIFKTQCLENYCRYTKILQESGNARNQSFSILQTEIKNIKEENQMHVNLTNESRKELHGHINFVNVEEIIKKEDTIQEVQDETISPELNKNINKDSNMTGEIKSSECEEQHDQTNMFNTVYIKEEIIEYEDSEESNKSGLLSNIKKESDSEQDTDENEATGSNSNKLCSKMKKKIKSFECEICNRKFDKKHVLKRHMKIHGGIKEFNCSVCEKKFMHKCNLNTHMMTHTGVKDFECSICNKKFRRKDNLNLHMKIHAGVKDYECPICKRRFTYKCILNTHMITHTGLRDFECSICKKKFSQNSDLKRHIKVHSGIRDYKCSICEKLFTQLGHLNLHLKTHTGVKEYDCSVCKKKFTAKSSLNVHMKLHTDITDMECSICEKKFIYISNLKKHMKAHTDVKDIQSSK